MILRLLLLPLRLLALLAALLGGTFVLLVLLSLPRDGTELTVPGLEGPVEIRWDDHGVPTIRAASEADGWFALGFVHARDRLWQMELRRRAARGRLAEILGPEALPMDRLVRTLGLGRRADASLAAFAPEDRARLEAYARGVDAFLGTVPLRPLPMLLLDVRPEPWRPGDSIAVQKLLALDLDSDWRQEMLRARLLSRLGAERFADLFPPPAGDEATTIDSALGAGLRRAARVFAALDAVLPPAGPGGASNAWAVDGSRSAPGGPILANDPHLSLEWPVVWYLARIETPEFVVTGATIPGLPAVVIGHSTDLAWGLTTTHADTQDLIGVALAADGSDREHTATGFVPLSVREERIRVRGAADEVLRVRESSHGPLVSDLLPRASPGGPAWALAWTALTDDDTTLAFGFRLPRARSGEDLAEAARLFVAPVHNLVWASRDGHIGFRVLGRVPLRTGRDGFLPVPPGTAEPGWRGLLDAAQMPAVVDPPTGRIVNANNRPTGGGRAALLARDWPDALRAERILELLDGRGRTTLADHAAIQLDVRSGLARALLPALAGQRFEDPRLEHLRRALVAWDGGMAAERFAPALFAAFYRELQRALYADELGPLFDAWRGTHFRFVRRILDARPVWCDDVGTPEIEDCAERVGLAFARAVSWLERHAGRPVPEIRWGDLHRAEARDPVFGALPALAGLTGVAGAIDGGRTTVVVAAWSDDEPFRVRHAPGLRMLVGFAPAPRGLWVIATGQSGRWFSPHARDLFEVWRGGGYVTIGDCATGACAVTRLRPAAAADSG